MNNTESIEDLKEQVKVLTKTIASMQANSDAQLKTIASMQANSDAQLKTIETMQANSDAQLKIIEELTTKISALTEIILAQNKNKEKLVNQLNGISKIAFPKKTEKRNYVDTSLKSTTAAPTPKERGNNGAKRKEYDTLEEIVDVVEPAELEFIKQQGSAKFISSKEVIRYELIPSKLIKHIYRCNKYSLNDTIFEGKAPASPFLNSNFDSSVIAYLMQQRFIYGLPVERIVRYLSEVGMDIPKPTAHGLINKGAELLELLIPVLKDAIFSDDYLHFDETYHTVLDKDSSNGSRKGYFWAVLSNKQKLINYFIDERASRSSSAFTSYVPNTYKGAIQADGYASYKVLDGWQYPKATRLGCMQHCKRKFLDIEEQTEAKEFIDIYNEFYRIRKDQPKNKWVECSKKVFDKLERRLREMERNKELLFNSKLSAAVSYSLNELEAIRNIILSENYQLDNNSIERPIRYISISRKNSMFCGSIKGAKCMAAIYSLAVSCRLNGVNTFTYFCDILNQLAALPVNVDQLKLRNLLPDKWGLE